MRFGARLDRIEAAQAAQNARLQAIQGQVSVVSSMLKETIIFQQVAYQKGIISHAVVKAELDRQHAALANQLEKISEATSVQSKDSGTAKSSGGPGQPGVLRDPINGGDPECESGPRIWTPG